MAEKVTVEIVDEIKDMVLDVASSYSKTLSGLSYSDIRLEVGEGKGTVAENGTQKYSSEDYGLSFGIRVLAGDRMIAPGYFGQVLGGADLPNLHKILKAGVKHAYQRAMANSERKASTKTRYAPLADSLYSTRLAPIEVHQDVVLAEYEIDPREVPLDKVVSYITDVSKAVRESDSQVKFNFVYGLTVLNRELFCSSEGASIDQSFAMTQGMAYISGPERYR